MNWTEYSKSILEKCKKEEIPYHACFELTPFCNFNCNMCYIHLNADQARSQGVLLSTEQWLHIARQAKALGTLTIEVTGGEAVTRPDFSILYESFIKMGFFIHLRTNGYLISDKILDLLIKYKPRMISITLYGASNETYNKICSVSDGFSVVTKNIFALRDAGLNIRLTMTVTKDNVDDMEALNIWAEKNNFNITPFGALVTPIRSAKRSVQNLKIRYSDEDCYIPSELQNIDYEVSDRQFLLNPFWMCRGFGAMFSVSWDGRMTICNTMTKIWTDPLSDGVENAYHTLYNELRELKRPKACNNCRYIEFCSACPSQILSATGDLKREDEEICRLARRRYKRYALTHFADNTFVID